MNKKKLMYIPHGIDETKFFPIENDMTEEVKRMKDMKLAIFKDFNPTFIVFYNNRNIRRKQTGNVILAFNKFCDSLPIEESNGCVLLMHTQPVDQNGTDLPVVANTLAPGKKIIFSAGKIDHRDLNCMYNLSDVTINMSNAEGFGLSTAESIMAGTPIMATVTGGLQDQMRFLDDDGNPIKFTKEWGTNSDGKVKNTHGEWVFPLFPRTSSLSGSVPTPYIMDDFSDYRDAADLLLTLYKMGRNELKRRGKIGREWMLTKQSGMNAMEMGSRFIKAIDTTIESWIPREKFDVYRI